MVRAENKVFDLVPGIWEELPSVVSYYHLIVFLSSPPPRVCVPLYMSICVCLCKWRLEFNIGMFLL